jgi:hypothetical protein
MLSKEYSMKSTTLKVTVLAACMVFLLPGLATADTLGFSPTSYTHIYWKYNGVADEGGAGSFQSASLNGEKLAYLYCVDILTSIPPGYDYSYTQVNKLGNIYGSALNNAGQVAWLLSTYGAAADTYDEQYALQAAIWQVVEGSLFNLDTGAGKTTDSQYGLYKKYLASLGSNTGNVSDFLWISPKYSLNGPYYQGMVGGGDPVPIPGAVWLLGSGLIGLVALRRRFRK